MRIEELKKGFWGYKKESVLRYIAGQEETFSQKLLEKDAQAEQSDQKAQERIQALERENQSRRADLARLREQQDQIAGAILDARASAEAIRAESRSQEEAARETVRRTLEENLAQLDGYRKKIEVLGESVRTALEGINRQLQGLEEQADDLAEAVPAGNLTLFQ